MNKEIPDSDVSKDSPEKRALKDAVWTAEEIETSRRLVPHFGTQEDNEVNKWVEWGGKRHRWTTIPYDRSKASEFKLPSIFESLEKNGETGEMVGAHWRVGTQDSRHASSNDEGYVLLYVNSGNQARVIVFDTKTKKFHWNSKSGPELPKGVGMSDLRKEYDNEEDQRSYEDDMRRLGRM